MTTIPYFGTQVGSNTNVLITEIKKMINIEEPSPVDQSVIDLAADEFKNNLQATQRVSKIGSFFGKATLLGVVSLVPVTRFTGKKKGGILAIITTVCFVAYSFLHDREGAHLYKAIKETNQEEQIRLFSLGINLDEKIDGYKSICKKLTELGMVESLDYILTIINKTKGSEKTKEYLDNIIAYVDDIATAKLLIGKYDAKVTVGSILLSEKTGNTELFEYLMEHKPSLSGNFDDYKDWETDLAKVKSGEITTPITRGRGKFVRLVQRGGPKILRSGYKTPFEQFIFPDSGLSLNTLDEPDRANHLKKESIIKRFTMLDVPEDLYHEANLTSADAFWEALNENGFRIRKLAAAAIHSKLITP
ncbi:MAG: hypothetical protein SP4CHLAM5_09610 [Chlamydiia bacterium]|nr:hypothetical protein [Chlamydiia bacterium]MCH9618819.1 hypothetical protein [Chlamydiia bacterium]MCH9624666.1 hypothetical protein [Chlamydiia bacterium]